MFPEQYIFEGETKVKCTRCGYVHTVSFSGINPSSIEQAIEEAMASDGWGVVSMTCPDCYDPLDEQQQRDRELEESALEDYADYDEEEYFGEEED